MFIIILKKIWDPTQKKKLAGSAALELDEGRLGRWKMEMEGKEERNIIQFFYILKLSM